jgi:lysozyme
MRHITKQGLNLIKRFEQFVPHIYICPAGYLTIGYGHVIAKHERNSFKDGIDAEKALDILARDLKIAEHAVLTLVKVPLTDGQFDSLVSFTFNVGSGAFQRSTLRQKVNREEHDEVPHEFSRWVFAGRRKLKGLITRRALEAKLYMG